MATGAGFRDPEFQDSDLTEREELLIVALSYINHQVLRALWELSRKQACERKKECKQRRDHVS